MKIIGVEGFIGTNLKNFEAKGDAVVYLASNTNAFRGGHRDEITHLKHLNYTLEDLESKIIYLSTGMVGRGAVSSYVWGKIAAEHLIKSYRKPYVILRCGNPYGPYQTKQGLIPALLRAVRDSEPIKLWAPLDSYKDYFYVDDLCELIVKICESQEIGVYNAGCGLSHSVQQIIELVTLVTGKEPKIESVPKKSTSPDTFLAVGRTRDDFDWEATTSIEEGIKKTWDYLLTSQSSETQTSTANTATRRSTSDT